MEIEIGIDRGLREIERERQERESLRETSFLSPPVETLCKPITNEGTSENMDTLFDDVVSLQLS